MPEGPARVTLASWGEKLAIASCALKGSIFPADRGIWVEESAIKNINFRLFLRINKKECQILYGETNIYKGQGIWEFSRNG